MYEVRIYKGDYKARQLQANKDNCIAYIEHHFNSSPSPNTNYSVVITGSNASEVSKNWGKWYAQEVAKKFCLRVAGQEGILVGGYDGRGDGNLTYTKMPAILLEPLFVSNPQGAEMVRNEATQIDLAVILVRSIQQFFPNGGIVGFSIGHKYKTSRPSDRGAAVYGGGWEADFAEIVLNKAKEFLEKPALLDKAQQQAKEIQTKQPPRQQIRVVQGNQLLWQHVMEEKETISWNGESNELTIKLIVDEDEDMKIKDGILTITVGNNNLLN